MPILADALDEAGCTNVEILAHCRQQGTHVRGCWIVDLLMAKKRNRSRFRRIMHRVLSALKRMVTQE
jgi:hypothetical protein